MKAQTFGRESDVFLPISARNNYLCQTSDSFYADKSWNLYQQKYTPKHMICQRESCEIIVSKVRFLGKN